MRASDLSHREFLELEPHEGLVRFAGQRAILLDADAMGMLRRCLLENFGQAAARALLIQFGFAQGWRASDAVLAQVTWDHPEEWQLAA